MMYEITVLPLIIFIICILEEGVCQTCPNSVGNTIFYGTGCKLRCHCADKSECDKPNKCSTCEKGFHDPPYCQKENVAYNKSAFQSSVLRPASQAVNGDMTDYSLTRIEDHPWWSVDLGKVTMISSLQIVTLHGACVIEGKIFTLCHSHLQGYSIYVTNRTITTEQQLVTSERCYSDDRPVSSSHLDFTVSPPRYGRHVVLLIHGPNPRFLIIVEFHVYECGDYSYGKSCDGLCNCKDTSEVCDKMDGSCRSGCPVRFNNVPGCRVCSDGLFGDKCDKLCQCKDPSEVCRKTDGYCSSGCASGYYNHTGCQSRCRCDKVGCDSETGSCDSYGGCRARFTNHEGRKDCQKACPDGKYIKDGSCAGICNCLNINQCNVTDGQCLDGKCRIGYEPPLCQEMNNLLLIPLIIVSCVLFMVLVMSAVIIICFKRKIKFYKEGSTTNTHPVTYENVTNQDGNDAAYVGMTDKSYEGVHDYEVQGHPYQHIVN